MLEPIFVVNKTKLIHCLQVSKEQFVPNSTFRKTNFSGNHQKEKQNGRTFLNRSKTNRNKAEDLMFKKHSNLVETNKQNILKTNLSRCSSRKTTTVGFFNENIKKPSINTTRYIPRQLKEIRKQFGWKLDEMSLNEKIAVNQQNLESILIKNKLKRERNLLGYNILGLQNKYNFSRFQLHNLYTTYQVLLKYAGNSLRRFQNGFQVVLNMNKIMVRSQVIDNIFSEAITLDFDGFIEMYCKIDSMIFKQNIIDYLNILFEGVYNRKRIEFSDIMRILNNRIAEEQSKEIATLIYQSLDKQENQALSMDQLYSLCHNCEEFRKKMYTLYTKEIKSN